MGVTAAECHPHEVANHRFPEQRADFAAFVGGLQHARK
jgi:hypothetical protein